VDSVADSAALVSALHSAGVEKRLVLGLRLDRSETAARVRVIEKKVADDVADRAVQAVTTVLRPVPAGRAWEFRLRVEGESQSLRLERSEVCAAAPGPRPDLAFTVRRVPAESLRQMQGDAQLASQRRRSLIQNVLVDGDGRPVAVQLLRSSGDQTIDVSEAEALTRRSFRPTKLDGAPVSAWVQVRGDYGR
jgi:Gram-negative bacterial TonB protein C-terminal